jgi:hypothetical protein
LQEDDKEADDRRRFKVQFALANVIDLNSLAEFCRGEKQNQKTKETMVRLLSIVMKERILTDSLSRSKPWTFFSVRTLLTDSKRSVLKGVASSPLASLVLLTLCWPDHTEGANPIAGGGLVYNGFSQ